MNNKRLNNTEQQNSSFKCISRDELFRNSSLRERNDKIYIVHPVLKYKRLNQINQVYIKGILSYRDWYI